MRLLLLPLLLTCTTLATAQFFTDFDAQQDLEVTVNDQPGDSLWQIGTPMYGPFQMALTPVNAIVTAPAAAYPAGAAASFTVRVTDEQVQLYPFVQLSWFQQLDTEAGVDGGLIEVSYDGGITYRNVFDDPDFQPAMVGQNDNIDTLFDGRTGFTGSSGWAYTAICWGQYGGTLPALDGDLLVRFTFQSDSSANMQAGWMLDNFFFENGIIGNTRTVDSNRRLRVRPNPAHDELTLALDGRLADRTELRLLDGAGRLLHRETLPGRELQNYRVSTAALPPGHYVLQLVNREEVITRSVVKQ